MRDIPPTPPIESKGKAKESHIPHATHAGARACACEGEALPPVIDVRTPPTLELLLAFAHLRCGFYDDDFTREWHRLMSDEYMWRHPESGRRISHWPAYFRKWRTSRDFFAKLYDPARLSDARLGGKALANKLQGSGDFERSFCDALT